MVITIWLLVTYRRDGRRRHFSVHLANARFVAPSVVCIEMTSYETHTHKQSYLLCWFSNGIVVMCATVCCGDRIDRDRSLFVTIRVFVMYSRWLTMTARLARLNRFYDVHAIAKSATGADGSGDDGRRPAVLDRPL